MGAFTWGLASPATARTWHVFMDGSGDAPTIQAGIDSASLADSVLVEPGNYPENIDFSGKDIVVTSRLGPDATTIDGSMRHDSVVLFVSGESPSALLHGFTLTGGTGHDYLPPNGFFRGGAIYCQDSCPSIRGNHIRSNVTAEMGGGIYMPLPGSSNPALGPLIQDNVFEDNHGYNGGAIEIDGGNPVITGNIFRNNSYSYDGGAISISMIRGSARIQNNEFWDNSAGDHGGAIYAANTYSATQVLVMFNLLVRNEARGIGVAPDGGGGAIWVYGFDGIISSNTMVANTAFGEIQCNGGGILLEKTGIGLTIQYNIIALGNQCGIACYGAQGAITTRPGPNMLWGNMGGDILYGPNYCPPDWANEMIIADPVFCAPETDNYTVSINSPALTGPEPFGVWTQPGCGPGVKVQPITWGRLKTTYR